MAREITDWHLDGTPCKGRTCAWLGLRWHKTVRNQRNVLIALERKVTDAAMALDGACRIWEDNNLEPDEYAPPVYPFPVSLDEQVREIWAWRDKITEDIRVLDRRIEEGR